MDKKRLILIRKRVSMTLMAIILGIIIGYLLPEMSSIWGLVLIILSIGVISQIIYPFYKLN